jgi:hypothetical protein
MKKFSLNDLSREDYESARLVLEAVNVAGIVWRKHVRVRDMSWISGYTGLSIKVINQSLKHLRKNYE